MNGVSDKKAEVEMLAEDVRELPKPWFPPQIDNQIVSVVAQQKDLDGKLSRTVLQNYNEFVSGVQQVQNAETQLSLINVLVKNGRRKFGQAQEDLVNGGLRVATYQHKQDRMNALLHILYQMQEVVKLDEELEKSIQEERYSDALELHHQIKQLIQNPQFGPYPCIQQFKSRADKYLDTIRRSLSDGLKVAAISTDLDVEKYELILKGYCLLAGHEIELENSTVAERFLSHIYECIRSVSKQCLLAFSSAPTDNSEWSDHNIKMLCKAMPHEHFADCMLQLYEHLCDFLHRQEFICAWHRCRLQVDEDMSPEFKQMCHDVWQELFHAKKNVWDAVQNNVSFILMTMDFQYPGLSVDNFLNCVHLTHLLIEEGDSYMQDWQTRRPPQPWSTPIRNTLKTRIHEWFQTFHFSVWSKLHASIAQEQWARLPLPRQFKVFSSKRIRAEVPSTTLSGAGANGHGSTQQREKARKNPFRDPRILDKVPPAAEEEEDGEDLIQDIATLMDAAEASMPGAEEYSSLLDSSLGPVLSSSTLQVTQVVEKYLSLMHSVPELVTDAFTAVTQLLDYYLHSVACVFVSEAHLAKLLTDSALTQNDPKIAHKHECYLMQQKYKILRGALLKFREYMQNLSPPGNMSIANLLDLTSSEKLANRNMFCGLAERCVSVESCATLTKSLEEIMKAMPSSGKREAVQSRYFANQHSTLEQLRDFVYSAAAQDMLAFPDLGRLPLDDYESSMAACKWDFIEPNELGPGEVYSAQLASQTDELAKRISCISGGSIPATAQSQVIKWIDLTLMERCADVVARIRAKSDQGLAALRANFKLLQRGEDWSFLEAYIDAHNEEAGEQASEWSHQHSKQYTFIQLESLLIHHKKGKNVVLALESHICHESLEQGMADQRTQMANWAT